MGAYLVRVGDKTNVLESKDSLDRFLSLNQKICERMGIPIEIKEQISLKDAIIKDPELAKMERRFELQTKQEKLEQELKKVKFELQKIESDDRVNPEKEMVFDE